MTARILSVWTCVLALLIATQARGEELLGGAMKIDDWTFEQHESATGKMSLADGALRLDVTAASSQAWHIQAYRQNLDLVDGERYQLTLTARADAPRKINVGLQNSTPEYEPVLPWQQADLTTEWKTFNFAGTAQGGREGSVRGPVLQLGDQVGTVWVKDISLVGKVRARNAPATALPPEFFPFVIGYDNAAKGSPIDVSALNEKVAGENGRIVVRNGRFAHEKTGQRVRFFAINVGGPETLAASHSDIDAYVDRLARAGVNLVRLHHFDNPWAVEEGHSLKDRTKAAWTLDAKNVDTLHYMIAACKKRGIYVNWNLKVSKQLSSADGFPEGMDQVHQMQSFDFQKRIDRFYEPLIEHQKKIAREITTSRNPYTGLSMIDDPAVAFFEINNENSLVNWSGDAPGAHLDKLPEPFKGDLIAKWNAFLLDRYKTDDALTKAWAPADVKNVAAPFNANTNWVGVGQQGGEVTTTTTDPSAASFNTTEATGVDWHVQGLLMNVVLQHDVVYTLHFDARADANRPLRISTDLAEAPYSNVGLNDTVPIGPEWKSFKMVFTSRNPDPKNNRLALQLGDRKGVLEIRNVKLTPGLDEPIIPPGQSLASKSVALSKNVTRQQRADYVDFLVMLDKKFSDEMRRFMREDLKCKALLTDTQAAWGGASGWHRETGSDFIDSHGYWNHPAFAGAAWNPKNWTVESKAQVDAFADGQLGTLGDLAAQRVANLPFTVSEYDHPATNDYLSEGVPMSISFAVAQDWDAIYFFCSGGFAGLKDVDRLQGFFDHTSNPSKFAFYPSMAILMRSLDNQANPSTLTIDIPKQAWRQFDSHVSPLRETTGGKIPLFSRRIGVALDRDKVGAKTSGPGDSITQMIKLSGVNAYTAAWDRAVVVTGFIGGDTVKAGSLSASIQPQGNNHATITLVSLDNQPIKTSNRLLLTAAGRSENVGMAWNAQRTSVSDQWGSAPVHIEGLAGEIRIARTTARKVYALDANGKRTAEVPARLVDDQLVFKINPSLKAVWYEIAE
jgi:hypothetical protein